MDNHLLLTGEECSWTKTSDEQIHQICQLYIQGFGVTEIAKRVGCGIDSVFTAVHGQNRTDVTSQYDIEQVYRGIISEERMHKVCQIFEKYKGFKYIDLKRYIINTVGVGINRREDSVLRNLYRHDRYCFYNISSQYNY